MAHKKEHVSTGFGFSVLNAGVKTEVINQAGEIKGNIKEALTYGSVYIGGSDGLTSELTIKTDTGFMVGNGTTAVVKTMSGDATMSNAGVVAITSDVIVNADIKSDAAVALSKLAAGAAGQIIVGAVTTGIPTYVAMSGDITIDNAGATTIGADKVTTAKILDANVTTGKITDLNVTTGKLAAAAVTQAKLSYEVVSVTVAAAATTGTATVTTGSIVLGYYPTGNQDQLMDGIAIATTTLTITLAAAATADNTFSVVLLKA